jgi:hypothetical protein
MLRDAEMTPVPIALDWRAETVARGTAITGIVVGKCRKFVTHVYGGITKPCLLNITDGALPCPCQTRGLELRVTGYLPIVTHERERVVVVMSTRPTNIMMKATQGSVYRFRRPATVKTAIIPAAVLGDDSKAAECHRMRPTKNQDISEFLCHLWQIHDLTKWCGFTPRRAIRTDAKAPITEKPYEPRFARGVLRTLASEVGKGEVA